MGDWIGDAKIEMVRHDVFLRALEAYRLCPGHECCRWQVHRKYFIHHVNCPEKRSQNGTRKSDAQRVTKLTLVTPSFNFHGHDYNVND